MAKKLLIFVAGPYTGETADETSANIQRAAAVAASVRLRGQNVVCPHTMTHYIDMLCDGLISYDDWLDNTLDILERCDAIVWDRDRTGHVSTGAAREWHDASVHGLQRFERLEDVPDLGVDDG